MAQVVGTNQVKLDNGQVIASKQGEWYDGQQFWGGSLSQPGQINTQSDQVGAGQQVSAEVNRQSDAAQGLKPGTIESFLQTKRQQIGQKSGSAASASYTPTTPTGQSGQTGAALPAPAPGIDLPAQFESLLASSGITEKEAQLSEMERSFIEAKGELNDNPFLNEASRVGREAKLTTLFNERTANIRGEIATSRADAETKLNLQLKQFDINSQQAKQALDQFNTLLNLGALDNASGEDIANITRGTGISSEMIRSAVEANKSKNVKTQILTSTDNAGRVTATVLNSNTGQVISKTDLGVIDKAKTTGGTSEVKPGSSQFISENKGAVSTFLFSSVNDFGHVSPGAWNQALQAWLTDSLGTRDQFIDNFKNLTDPNRGDFETQSGYSFPLFERNE